MSDRKYRQRGYQDEPRTPRSSQKPPQAPKDERPREMRTPNMPGFREVFRCARCGNVMAPDIGSLSRCTRCGVDLHACIHCQSFDPSSRFECMQVIPARVSPKDARNECALFSPKLTMERETSSASSGPPSAKKAFDDLFKF
jgi:hypothetical protein